MKRNQMRQFNSVLSKIQSEKKRRSRQCQSMKNSFPLQYCPKNLWLCLSFGILSVALLTLILLFVYHYHRNDRMKENTKKKISRRSQTNVDEQVNALLRSTPVLPVQSKVFNQVNQIHVQTLHSVKTDLPDKPNGIHNR